MTTAREPALPVEPAVPVDGGSSARRRPGMHDVARLAGVSHQTVSRVLNDHPHVRPVTRDRVIAAIDELGYRRNSVARALVTGAARTLGVVSLASTLHGPVSMLHGVEAAARARGYSLVVTHLAGDDTEALDEAVERLQGQGVAGMIVIASLLPIGESLSGAAWDLPVVALGNGTAGRLPLVSIDNRAGARLATEHLLGLGHRAVWHISGPSGWPEATERLHGWRAALEAVGIEAPPALTGDWSPGSGYRAGQMLARIPEVTAVFAANDQMALGLLRAMHEHGRRVPEDVSVVGFDDIPEAAYLLPPLTTVRQPFDSLGRRALELLLDQIEADRSDETRLVVQPEMIVRHSTRRPGGERG